MLNDGGLFYNDWQKQEHFNMINSISEITQLWDRSLKKIEERLGEKQLFDSFFAGSYINEIHGDTIVVVVNSSLAAALIKQKYYDLVEDVVSEITESNFKLDFCLRERSSKKALKSRLRAKNSSIFQEATLNPKLTFDNFVVGSFNREASQASLFVASNPGKTLAQPLFIYSNSGLGKTHLLHAIGNYIKNARPNFKILYISTSDFVEGIY